MSDEIPLTFDHLPDPVIAFDRDDRVVAWNRAAEQLFRLPADAAAGRPVRTFVPDAERPHFTRAAAAARRAGAWAGDLTLQTATDRPLTVEVRWAAGPDGIVIGTWLDVGAARAEADAARRADRWAVVRSLACAVADDGSQPDDVRDLLWQFAGRGDPDYEGGIYRGAGTTVVVAVAGPLLRAAVGAVLDAAGYQVVTAVDRFAAAEALADNRGRVQTAVVGFGPATPAAVARMRRVHPGVPVVVVGPHAPESDDGVTVVPDPLDPRRLVRAVAEAVVASHSVDAAGPPAALQAA